MAARGRDLVKSSFDRRVISDELLALIRTCQAQSPCHLGGGGALAGAWLGHRQTRDIDLFCHDAEGHRELARLLPELGRRAGLAVSVVRDAGTFVRARVDRQGEPAVELDLVYEPSPDLEPPGPALEGVVLESLTDLRASKLTCLLSRSEPRDLVDVLFLERAGYTVEQDLPLALQKDAGIDPGVLAWLLGDFPVEPLPAMLEPLTPGELRAYRDALRERLRRWALPNP